jgi:hypothetical protein
MKYISIVILLSIIISCSNNSTTTPKENKKIAEPIIEKDNFAGKWIGCGYNKGQKINIELVDGNYVITDKKYKPEWVFTKISPTLIEAWDGMISFRFESKTGHIKLIDGGPTEEFKKLN